MRGILVASLLIALPCTAIGGDCSCPTVKAKGKGNTSCSVNESGGWCTIDYNLFSPAVESRAAQFVERVTGVKATLPQTNQAATFQLQQLAGQPKNFITRAVAVYLVVGAFNQMADRPETVSEPLLARAVKELQTPQAQSLVADAFSLSRMSEWDSTSKTFSNESVRKIGNLIVSPGCVEYKETSGWLMFKASWAAAKSTAQCSRQ